MPWLCGTDEISVTVSVIQNCSNILKFICCNGKFVLKSMPDPLMDWIC